MIRREKTAGTALRTGGGKPGKAAMTALSAISAIVLVFAVPAVLTGCSRGPGKTETAPPAVSNLMLTAGETEAETEEIEYRSIREVVSEETAAWMEAFRAADVEKVTYVILGEEREEYAYTDQKVIAELFEAIDQIVVAGPADVFAEDAGDEFTFYMKDQSEQRFSFMLSNVMVDDQVYETDNSDALWELTNRLLEE